MQRTVPPVHFWPDRDLKTDFCDAGAMLNHLSYQANCEPANMWVEKVLVDDLYIYISKYDVNTRNSFISTTGSGTFNVRMTFAVNRLLIIYQSPFGSLIANSRKLLNFNNFKVNVKLHQQLDPRPFFFVFHCFFFVSPTLIQWLSCIDCKNKVKATSNCN